MENNNRNLIIAYFRNAPAAAMAAQHLQFWDKGEAYIQLGGLGVVTLDGDQLETHNVGTRIEGTGVKWRAVLGATGALAPGILATTAVLTGGLGATPDRIDRLLLGADVIDPFHKRIGMSDWDRLGLIDHLEEGGAILTVMADDAELNATERELEDRDAKTDHYRIPDEEMEAFDAFRHEVFEILTSVAGDLSSLPVDVQEIIAEMIVAAPSLETAAAAALHDAGIAGLSVLRDRAASYDGRGRLADAASVAYQKVQNWAHDIDMTRIRGLGPKYLALLNDAGIKSIDELALYSPDYLSRWLHKVNVKDSIVKRMPSDDDVAYWIEQARGLPPYLYAIQVKKGMLDENAYSWHAVRGDDPNETRIDALTLNRHEGYEVEVMIQKVCNTFGFETEEDVKQVETVINTELPSNLVIRNEVYDWLVDYFLTH